MLDSFAPLLQPFVDRHELAGAVTCVADKDRILKLEAVGFSDVTAQTPMTTDALFWIASQTKPITAAALMMLVDEGLVNIHDAVEKYLPEFSGQMLIVEQDENHRLLRKPNHPLTVCNVLTHTGGLPFLTPVEQPYIDNLSLRDAAQIYALLPLQSEPGARYVYSNVGINLAGRIIEVASGQSYESFLQERLFDPLGMKNTTFWPNSEQLKLLAKSYRPDESNQNLEATPVTCLRYPLDNPCRHATPGGGLFSTARDVVRFCQMILRGGEFGGQRLLSPQSVRQMTSRQTPDELESYGYGWQVGEDGFGHGGAYSTKMTIDSQNGLISVFLVQHAGFPGDGAACREAFHSALSQQLS